MLISVVIGCLLLKIVSCDTVDYANDPAVKLFQEYIQINTTTYNDLQPAIDFWQRLADEQDVVLTKHEYETGLPVLVIKWPGSDPDAYGIMLNSHMDVVPADESDGWTYPPFSGFLSEDGDIYGRGTQDMKSVAIQYYEALKRLKEKNITLIRNVYMTLMPDEEVGGQGGMVPFSVSDDFKALNIGFEMDEGGPSPTSKLSVIYQDKSVWQIRVDCHGTAAHGSTFPTTNSTATGKCYHVTKNLFEFRDHQRQIAVTAPTTDASVYTSLNLNILSGGTANNIIPGLVSLVFDIRLNTRLDEHAFQKKLEETIHKAGEGINVTYLVQDPQSPATITDSTNPYWNAVTKGANDSGIELVPIVPSGSTDARALRRAGIPALGMSPLLNTTIRAHGVNEYLAASTFLNGIDLYENIILELGSIPANETGPPSDYLVHTSEPGTNS